MPWWAWVLIAAVVIVLLALVGYAVLVVAITNRSG